MKMPRGKDKRNYTMYNETLYEVDRVVQIKWVKNRQFCYIKWKGYDERYNTWEPREHITFCYDYVTSNQKDDDPEYRENTSIKMPTKHHYQTRAKLHPPKTNYKPNTETTEDKQGHTNVEELNSTTTLLQTAKIAKLSPEMNISEVQIQSKNGEKELSWKTQKEKLIKKILCLFEEGKYLEKNRQCDEKQKKKIYKVQLQNGETAKMSEDHLKAHYPKKVIEYLQHQLRARSHKSNQ